MTAIPSYDPIFLPEEINYVNNIIHYFQYFMCIPSYAGRFFGDGCVWGARGLRIAQHNPPTSQPTEICLMPRSPFLAACFLALATSQSSAAPVTATQTASDIISRYDRNHDQTLDLTEFDAMRRDMFDRIDSDHDGNIRAEDVATAAKAHGGRADGHRLMARDADRNGQVSWAEFSADTRGFARMDRNGDGRLGTKELARLLSRLPAGLGPI